MATGTVPPTPPPLPPEPPSGPSPEDAAPGRYVEFESYIENRIKKTRGQVKGLEITVALIALVAGVLGYLLVVAIFDHWVVAGGLGFWGRLFALVGLLAGATYWFWRRVLPVFLRPINPVYAAREIERNQTNLKNSLINFLLLKSHRGEVSPAVFHTLEQRAATDLSALPGEAILDRSRVIRFGYGLLAVVAVCCLYTLLSPKSPLKSIARIMLPWQDIAAVTRVTIANIRPGDTTAFHDEVASVSAIVEGAGRDEPVTLFYTTTDERIVDRALPMHVLEGDYRHTVQLPGDASGFQHSLDYYITAGDARSPTYRVEVVSAPMIIVARVEYEYPAYTGLAPRVAERQGDLRGIDGTRVVLYAKASREIDEAHVDFDADGRRDLKMTVEGREAKVGFNLSLDSSGRPLHTSYVLRFHDNERNENLRPARYTIEVIPDMRPEVELIRPGKDNLLVAENGALTMAVRAMDRDFALDQVSLVVQHDRELVMREVLLGEQRSGEFRGSYIFRPADHGLSAGDQIVYWAEAADNRRPTSNHDTTVQYHLEVVDRLSREEADDEFKAAERDRKKLIADGEDRAKPGAKHDEHARDTAEDKDGEHKADGEAEEPDDKASEPEAVERIDPITDAGDAFEKLHDRFQQDADEEDQADEGTPQDDGGDSSDDMNDQGGDSQSPQDGSPEQESGKGDSDQSSQQGEGSDGKGPDDSATSDGEAGKGEAGKGGSEKGGADSDSPGGQKGGASGSEESGQPSAAPGEDKPSDKGGDSASDKTDGQGSGTAGAEKPQQETTPGENAEGKGGSTSGSGKVDSDEPPGEMTDEGGDKEGGDPNNKNNQSGDGKSSKDQTGSPQPQEKNRQSDTGKPSPEEGREANPNEADSPSTSPKQSDSSSDTEGDRSGGGGKGGGQNANREGTGGAGSNTAADEGSGESSGSGEGNTSSKPGERQKSDRATDQDGPKGNSGGSKVKDGSKTGDGPPPEGAKPERQDGASSGDVPSDAPKVDGGQKPPDGGQPAKGSDDSSAPPGRSGNQAGDAARPSGNLTGKDQPDSTAPLGGKQDSDGTGGGGSGDAGGGDDPNLEYAKKATDLVLERLQDQIDNNQVDQEMLDELGWTKDDLKKFVDRWKKMREDAQQGSDEGKQSRRRLDNALKGLGLRPRGTSLEHGRIKKTTDRQTRASRRTQPPAEYREQYEAYSKSLAKDKSGDRGSR